jgi:hypothetical protein
MNIFCFKAAPLLVTRPASCRNSAMKLTTPHPAIHETFCAELDESRYVQVHVFRARARYFYSSALVKKKITLRNATRNP